MVASGTPLQVRFEDGSPLEDVVSVSAGWNHTCAVQSTGHPYCWGSNSNGQLGDGTVVDRRFAVRFIEAISPPTTAARSISAGGSHTCALVEAYTFNWVYIYCVGKNSSGQLGNGKTEDALVGSLTGITSITAYTSISCGYDHSCAVMSDKLYCWGSNAYGGAGQPLDDPENYAQDAGNRVLSPVAVGDGAGGVFVARGNVSVGKNFSCAIGLTSAVSEPLAHCFGDNSFGQLGRGETTMSYFPHPLDLAWGNTFANMSISDYELDIPHFTGDSLAILTRVSAPYPYNLFRWGRWAGDSLQTEYLPLHWGSLVAE